jgi:hypothetical protein
MDGHRRRRESNQIIWAAGNTQYCTLGVAFERKGQSAIVCNPGRRHRSYIHGPRRNQPDLQNGKKSKRDRPHAIGIGKANPLL